MENLDGTAIQPNKNPGPRFDGVKTKELEKHAEDVSIAQRQTGRPDDGRPDRDDLQLTRARNHDEDLHRDETTGGD